MFCISKCPSWIRFWMQYWHIGYQIIQETTVFHRVYVSVKLKRTEASKMGKYVGSSLPSWTWFPWDKFSCSHMPDSLVHDIVSGKFPKSNYILLEHEWDERWSFLTKMIPNMPTIRSRAYRSSFTSHTSTHLGVHQLRELGLIGACDVCMMKVYEIMWHLHMTRIILQ